MGETLDGTLGVAVRELRENQQLTQAAVARLAGVSRRHIAAIEKGANVSVLVVVKVARVLGATELPLGGVTLTAEAAPAPRIPEVMDVLDRIDELTTQARHALLGITHMKR
jgi:transcriptional regulator with XRE-family HTH domain